jgi:apolipoprotein N-acyltransferase
MRSLGFILNKKSYLFTLNFLLGLSLAFSFEPFNVPFLSVIVIGLYFLLNDFVFQKLQSYYKIFFYNGLFFGFGFFLLGMYWVSNSILEFDPDLYYVVPIIFILFPVSLSIFFGLMQIVNAFLWSESNSKIFYFSSVWIIFEFLRSILFTGLPWNLVGYSWSWSLKYSQAVSFLGIYGLGLLTVFCSACIFSFLLNNKNKPYLITAIIILTLLYIYGFFRINYYQVVFSKNDLRIVHTHLNQKDKWTKQSIDNTAAMGSPNLITVFPETSLGFDSNRPQNWIVGYIRKDEDNFFNSVSYMGFSYDKKILVPFGEYFPLSKLFNIFFPHNLFFKNELTRGNSSQIFPTNITPLICYEVIFPSLVRKSISNNTDLLVNISNDGWFGSLSGPRQHFVHAQFRSIELGIPMVRSSNKGISGLIGPKGEIISVVDSSKTTYLDVKIPKKLETTAYRVNGNFFTYFLIVLFFIIGYAIRSKQKK